MLHTCSTRPAVTPTHDRGDPAHCGRVVPRRIPQAAHLIERARRREHRRPLAQAATRISLACLQAVAHRNAGGWPLLRGVARIDVFEC